MMENIGVESTVSSSFHKFYSFLVGVKSLSGQYFFLQRLLFFCQILKPLCPLLD